MSCTDETMDLKLANTALRRFEAMLRNACHLAKIGTWELDLETRSLTFSDEVYAILGVSPDLIDHSYDGFTALIHPDDRDALCAELDDAIAGGPAFDRVHRIVLPAGETRTVRETAEILEIDGRRVVVGVMRELTEEAASSVRADRAATELLRIAGHASRLGGWRDGLASGPVEWTELADGLKEVVSTLDHAFAYYEPAYRTIAERALEACMTGDRKFDEVLEIVTANGTRRWVHALGEAEVDVAGRIVAVRGGIKDVSELVAAESEREALAARLHATLESISDALLVVDRSWRCTYVNSNAARMLERSREALLGVSLADVFPAAEGSPSQANFQRAIDTGRRVAFTAPYPRLRKCFSGSAFPTEEGLAIYFQDVTEARAQQEKLRLLEAAVAHMRDVLVISEVAPIDAPDEPRIVYANAAVLGLTGFTVEEVVGQTQRVFRRTMTHRDEVMRVGAAVAKRQPVRTETLNYTKNGEPYWVEMETVPLDDADGTVTHVAAVGRDVTERRRAEAALQMNEERFRLIAQATNDVIWDWDLVTNELWNSDRLAALLGPCPEPIALTREGWLESIHADDRARVRLATSTHLANATTSWTEEYRIDRNDGTEAVVVDRASIIRDETGRPVRVLGSLLDVTERRQLDQRLLVAERLEAVAQLTGGLAHDFNNLLTVILGNAETLADRIDDPDLRALTEMMATAAEHGAELTSRLLSFARRQVLQSRSVDVAELVDSMGVLLRRTLPETIEIAFTHADGLGPALVDPGQLEAAVLNLAINARDAMPAGGRLTIDTRRDHLSAADVRGFDDLAAGPYAVVAITDTGTGMSDDTLARAFEPFFTTKEVGKGSGLGLAMVYGFVKQSGGHVAVTSKLGAGTTIKLFLPLAKPAGDASTVQPVAAPAMARGREHVLVVEDNELVRLSVTAQLRRLGYRVSEADSGATALASMTELGDVDLLFTDLVMPGGMSGAELAKKAWDQWPSLKVLFTSGYAESARDGNGSLGGSVPLLTKPYRRHDLAAKLRQVLDAEPGAHSAVPANQGIRCDA